MYLVRVPTPALIIARRDAHVYTTTGNITLLFITIDYCYIYCRLFRARCSASGSACAEVCHIYLSSRVHSLHGRAQLENVLRRTTTHHRHLAPQLAVRELLAEVHITEVAHVRVEFERALRWRGRRMARSRRDLGALSR